ncbi:MAG: hypothetical protein K9M15_01505 [Candidatus Marinimicrobia bacterium]|nr:hypothetical protein [Candidatus Neomarinimicrobiota bacterium]
MIDQLLEKLYRKFVLRKEDNDVLCLGSYSRLLIGQIKPILEIVDNEAVESFHGGLTLSRKDLVREKIVILTVLNKLGNPHFIRRNYDYPIALRALTKHFFAELERGNRFYFGKLKTHKKLKTLYHYHVSAVLESILDAIHKGEIPYT